MKFLTTIFNAMKKSEAPAPVTAPAPASAATPQNAGFMEAAIGGTAQQIIGPETDRPTGGTLARAEAEKRRLSSDEPGLDVRESTRRLIDEAERRLKEPTPEKKQVEKSK